MILPLSTDPRRKVAAQKRLYFAKTDYRLTHGFPHAFHRLYHRFKEQQLG